MVTREDDFDEPTSPQVPSSKRPHALVSLWCLSLIQPWAWAMLAPDGPLKDIENRGWLIKRPHTGGEPYRGALLVHAAKNCSQVYYEWASRFIRNTGFEGPIPSIQQLERGGVVGAFDIHGHIPPEQRAPGDYWHMEGKYGHQVRTPVQLPFRAYRGLQKLFKVELTAQEQTILTRAGLI